MNPVTKLLLGKIGEDAAEGRLTGNRVHSADATQNDALSERLNEMTGAGQIQNGFGQQGARQGAAVQGLSAATSLPRRCNSLLNAHYLQNLYQSLQPRRQLQRSVALKQREELFLDLIPVGSKLVDGSILAIRAVVRAW